MGKGVVTVKESTAAARIKREAAAREALMKAGERWHRIRLHAGPYDRCPVQSCYFTHRLVSR